ncbi:hypothetical protein F0259_18850 [Vibrio cyclitrophicus]|uniref:hypothetical protein n=1 Tax=Vibrio TaxID=662 RepID=UPI00037B5553|nr:MULTISPECIES: hypothetical protein [Vibrio]CAK1939619.1 Chromosome partitioning protein ParA [Vibrio crassostreae]NOH45852.1 hypothetical protein [Vibrio cyclitrophicus]CAK1944469.1 Chromosome partitioning protein ParA [Vibrio crassostreae]CAK1957743.1 Chromosome partitioning protein ParA [Vibrio crassostreae]CAK1966433.1 Chromosome partitioning protein ParA [Vibrio crassostreae]
MKPSIIRLFVETYYKEANRDSQNRNKRTNEARRVAAQVEKTHGKIPRLGMILRKLPDNLYHSYEPKRNSFGYKETTQKLQETINEVMGRNMF